ncbi:hypothetical protein GOODEAATRI_014411 [Goodea atripinnis]|uniref:Uncharacterized protein n=1 Tax=Goodea atripinnis TaxID=208336 RepID=A0ABV0NK87_9TELE
MFGVIFIPKDWMFAFCINCIQYSANTMDSHFVDDFPGFGITIMMAFRIEGGRWDKFEPDDWSSLRSTVQLKSPPMITSPCKAAMERKRLLRLEEVKAAAVENPHLCWEYQPEANLQITELLLYPAVLFPLFHNFRR